MEDVTTIDILAQDVMDMYYGEFKEENENFHDIDFFTRFVHDARGELLRGDYEQSYKLIRGEGVVASELVRFSGMWVRTEVIEFTEDKESGYYTATPSTRPFTFLNDNSNTGIQSITPVHRKDSCTFSRIRPESIYLLKHMPKGIMFWWPENDKIFSNSNCCKKAKLHFVPERELSEIPTSAANQIKDRIFDLIRKSEGKIVDTTNDSNPVVIPQTEANKEQAR